MRVGGICVSHYKGSKTVSLWCRCCHSALGLFQVQECCSELLTIRLSPRLTTCEYARLTWDYLSSVFVSAASRLPPCLTHSLSLCHDSYVPLYAQTQTDSWLDDFWLRRESASAHASSVVVWAQQVLATSLLLSSVLCVLVLECTVLQTQLKKNTSILCVLASF